MKGNDRIRRLLREITGQARNRVYQADQVLAVIEAPQGQADDAE